MKRKKNITFVLIFISSIMLVIPVIPHHHHNNNGLICMKNDITANCCGQQHTTDSEHCCCDTGCVTAHFFQQTHKPNNEWEHPCFPLVITLFSEPILNLLLLPEGNRQKQEYIYLESLHGTYITRATGLRAPPCALI